MPSSYYLDDAIGSTTELINSTQMVTDRYIYDAFGNQRSATDTTKNPFRYVGQLGYYYDQDTGTINVRAREYQPTIIRWLSEDPLLHGGFSSELYRPRRNHSELDWNSYWYAHNSSIDVPDPSGLAPPTSIPNQYCEFCWCHDKDGNVLADTFINCDWSLGHDECCKKYCSSIKGSVTSDITRLRPGQYCTPLPKYPNVPANPLPKPTPPSAKGPACGPPAGCTPITGKPANAPAGPWTPISILAIGAGCYSQCPRCNPGPGNALNCQECCDECKARHIALCIGLPAPENAACLIQANKSTYPCYTRCNVPL